MDRNNVIVKMNGEEIKPISTIEYSRQGKYNYPKMEYYHRKGSVYYFRNKIGIKIIFTTNESIHNHLKYGQTIDFKIEL